MKEGGKVVQNQGCVNILFTLVMPQIYFMTSVYFFAGSKQQSHQDYLEKADKARSERLSSSKAK